MKDPKALDPTKVGRAGACLRHQYWERAVRLRDAKTGGALTLHPVSLPYSSVTLLVSHAPLNYLGFFEPYVAFVFVIFIQGGLKTGKKKSGGL